MFNPQEVLNNYQAPSSTEEGFKNKFFELLEEKKEQAFLRENLERHFTASAFVVSDNKEKILLLHHKKLDKWIQPGGHADGEMDLLEVAKKEFFEETGILNSPKIEEKVFHIDIHSIPEHKNVPAHEHYDWRFLFQIPATTPLNHNEESLGLRWFTREELKNLNTDKSVIRMAELAFEAGYLAS